MAVCGQIALTVRIRVDISLHRTRNLPMDFEAAKKCWAAVILKILLLTIDTEFRELDSAGRFTTSNPFIGCRLVSFTLQTT